MNRVSVQPGRVAARRVILWVGLVVTLALLVMMIGTLRAFDTAIQPELEKRSRLIGLTVRDSFEHALAMGVPLASVAGGDRFINDILQDFDDVQSITLRDVKGDIIVETQRDVAAQNTVISRVTNVGTERSPSFTLPILNRNRLVGEIQISFDPGFVITRLQDVLLDVFVVALVAILLAFELVIFVMAGALGKPLDRIFTLLRMQAQGTFNHIIPSTDAGQLRAIARRLSDRAVDLAERAKSPALLRRLPQAYFVDIRLALFIFSLATEISGAFLPLYARDAGGPAWMSRDFAATLPLIAYLAAIAMMAPFGGWIIRRISPRKLFILCIPFTALAMIGVGLGQSAIWIALWHGAMALVYAIATIACQEYAIRTAPEGENAQAIGSYLFVIMGGAFCGTALGGVLADRIGESGTFFFGAALVIVAGLLGAVTISAEVGGREDATMDSTVDPRKSFAILFNPRLLALVIGIGTAMNIGMSVFIWYLTPVIMEAEGARIADIGRTMMLYYLAPVIFGPLVARLADSRIGNVPLLIGGAALSGVALCSLAIWSGFWPMVAVVTVFGIGFAMCDATQYAQVIKVADASGLPGARNIAMSALRLYVRIIAIAGLLLSSYLIERFDYLNMAIMIGVLMLAGAAILLIVEGANTLLGRGQVEHSDQELPNSQT